MDKLVSPIARAAPQMKDSTSNANHGTSAGSMLSTDQVSAEIDGGLSFDGSNNEITCGNGASLQIITALTMEAWAKPISTGVIQGIVNKEIGFSELLWLSTPVVQRQQIPFCCGQSKFVLRNQRFSLHRQQLALRSRCEKYNELPLR